MKKFVLILTTCLFILTGCENMDMDDTPTKKVEAFLNNYQTLDEGVLEDLDTVLANDTSLSDNDKEGYRKLMEDHYRDLKYEIKDERIDGDKATVDAEVTVRNYSKAVAGAEDYKSSNEDKFQDEKGNYSTALFSSYRLDEMEKVTDTATYTITFSLIIQNEEWTIEELSDEDLNKINGLYAG